MPRILLFLILAIAPFRVIIGQFSIVGQQPSCYGSCNGSAHINDSTGNNNRYLWSTGDTIIAVSNLCSGPYQCIVSDSMGTPLDTLFITLQQPAALIITPAVLKNEPCYGDTAGYVIFHAAGGTGTRYSFNWSTGYQGFLSDSAQFNLVAGIYAITITDANSCTASVGFSITQPAPITVVPQVTNASTCSICNGSVLVRASGGSSATFSYNWSNGSTSAVISNLCAGPYGLSVADTTGCVVSTSVNVFPNQNPLTVQFSVATNIDCVHPTGFLYASPAGGAAPYHYSWNTGSRGPDIFNLQADIYQVSVTDSAGCFAVATDTIQNLGIVITTLLRQDFRCDVNTGKIEIAVSQGSPPYALHWSNYATGDTLNGLRPGIYTVTVFDQANCSVTATDTIAQINTSLVVQAAVNNVTCLNMNNGNALVSVTGGLAPYNYLWNDPSHQTTDTAINLAAGNYRVRVFDAFGCSVFAGVNIIDSYNSQVTTTASVGNCDSTGSVTANISVGTPPYSYLWDSQPQQTTATANNLAIGHYSVSVTDSTGCIRTGSANIQYSCFGIVTGAVFYDNNANCIIDNGEQGIAGVPVLVTNSQVTFEGTTNLNGDYSIPVTATGTYTVIVGVNASSTILQYGNNGCGYLEMCPASDTITFVTLKDTFQHHNFGFVGTPGFDLAINAGWSPVNTSHIKEYWILYANQAFLLPYTNTATITFNYDPNLTFQSGIPTPINNAATHTLTWTVDSLPSPTFVWGKRVKAFFNVPENLPASYELSSNFHIDPFAGDCDTANNSIYTSQIAGSPDKPVSKEVSPRGDISDNDSILTYSIYFQNNGADTAHFIKIIDTLSPYLDPASVQNIACNPLYNQFYIAPGVALTWVFSPANVPAGITDSLASRGFVSFTAKLKKDAGGYTVKNQASVLIDNNAQLYTNTTSNYITFPVSVSALTGNPINVRVFPNPFDNLTNVAVEGLTDKYDFELMDMAGRVVRRETSITNDYFQLNRGQLVQGVYIYGIYTNGRAIAYGKLIVE